MVRTSCALAPESTSSRATSVRISSPAPASSTTATATSTTASDDRTSRVRREAELRPVASASDSGTWLACQAGASPDTTPVHRVSRTANAATRRSSVEGDSRRQRPGGHERGSQSNCRGRQGETRDAANCREEQALGHQLPQDAPAAPAERGAHGDFAGAADAPGKEEVRDIGARHQQDEADDAAEDERGGLQIAADERVAQRLDGDAPAFVGGG